MERGFSSVRENIGSKRLNRVGNLGEPIVGSSNIWFDNWTRLGALNFVVEDDFWIDESIDELSSLMIGDQWIHNKLQQLLPEIILEHISWGGDLIYASAVRIPDTTRLYADTEAFARGIDYYVENHLLLLVLENDSLSLKKIVEENGNAHGASLC
ncbi:hypothetical protein HAX54_021166 [Datura stramonium]|uniref:Uncharacterized protein n=1 Tax=Datura stramonium TaxID=4076 RepID=A0ABS8USH9_DATST|nr:hypothetical protein [Datura stramonium]